VSDRIRISVLNVFGNSTLMYRMSQCVVNKHTQKPLPSTVFKHGTTGHTVTLNSKLFLIIFITFTLEQIKGISWRSPDYLKRRTLQKKIIESSDVDSLHLTLLGFWTYYSLFLLEKETLVSWTGSSTVIEDGCFSRTQLSTWFSPPFNLSMEADPYSANRNEVTK
jgi:hypothetical protein